MTALRKSRDKRKLPYLDNKIITSRNGLMIDAFARAGQRMGKPEYTEAARLAADFILTNLRKKDGALYRTWRDDKAEIAAYFEDYAFMIQGLVSTYRATKEDRYLQAAKELSARHYFSRKLKWDPSDFSSEKSRGGYCLRLPGFVLRTLRHTTPRCYAVRHGYRNDLTPCRMALYFDYASAIAPTPSKHPASTATRGSSYTDPLALRFLYSFAAKAKKLFWDEKHGGYYFTDGSEQLLVRMKNAMDSAIPSGNAVMAQALLDLYEITGDAEWKQQAEALLNAYGQAITDNPRGYTHMVHALLRLNHLAPAAKATQQPDEVVNLPEAMETKAYVKVSASEPKREGNSLNVTAVLDIAESWHINANPASLDFLIPTSVDVREDSGKAEVKPAYPDALAMTTPLGDIKVYEGKVSIPVKVTLLGSTEILRMLVRAQACKDTTCLAPSDWVIPVKLKYKRGVAIFE
jgi:uncharacterized protein YyaL (SSP411 family)